MNTPQPRPNTWLGIIGVLLALSAPIIQVSFGPFYKLFAFPVDRLMTLIVFWIPILLAVGIAHFGEGYSLARFGFAYDSTKTLRTRLIEWIIAVVAAFVTGVVFITFSNYVRTLLTGAPMPNNIAILKDFPYWVLIPAWITSWIEELAFRSYPIERLTDLTGKRWLAALISLLAFTLLHWLTWDWIHVFTAVLPAALMLTLFYLWKRNLALNMIIHAILNMPLLIVPLIARYL